MVRSCKVILAAAMVIVTVSLVDCVIVTVPATTPLIAVPATLLVNVPVYVPG